ncbi:MAG: divalent-cation tolerance protein CutA [Acidobacteria bacterium]|nr:divalent-cation tolerance protein CutA [Acidobacteriota bacterium]
MDASQARYVVVLTTVPLEVDVEAFAQALVAERLAACVNVLPPMHSVFRWQGAIETAAERQVVMKTCADRVETLRERVHARHPFAVPEFLVLPVDGGSEPYLEWIYRETRRP